MTALQTPWLTALPETIAPHVWAQYHTDKLLVSLTVKLVKLCSEPARHSSCLKYAYKSAIAVVREALCW